MAKSIPFFQHQMRVLTFILGSSSLFLSSVFALRPKDSQVTDLLADTTPTKLVIERKRRTESSDSSAKKDEKKTVATSLTISQADPPPTEKPTKTGVWQIHHDTTNHQKVPNGGYAYGSPLYGQNMASIQGVVPQAKLPVSTTMTCIMILCAQFFVILTGCALAKTSRELSGSTAPPGAFLIALQAARSTLSFVPMVCCLFLACRMRSVQLAQGDSEKYGLPPGYVQDAMWAATCAIGIQCLLVLLMPVLGRMPSVDEDGNLVISSEDNGTIVDPRTGQQVNKPSSSGGIGAMILVALRFLTLITLWVSISMVIAGVWIMDPPAAIWGKAANMDSKDYPWPAPAVQVTMDQCCLFFMVYGLSALFRELGPQRWAKILGLLGTAMHTVALAPMFCILFIGARMRALQMDPLTGSPQKWAQDAMFAVDFAMIAQVATILIVGGCMKGEVMRGNCEGDIRFRVQNGVALLVITAIRWLCLIGIYVGSVMVLYSVAVIEHPKGADETPPVSPAMKCVMILTTFYLIIYFGLFLGVTLRQQFPANEILGKWVKTFDHARSVVFFAPMMCVLYIGTRMRALQMTGNKGAPQGYAQDWMYLSTWSVTLQTLLCICMGLCSGREVAVDEDGNVKPVAKPGSIAMYVMEGFRYFCMIAMYGGACGLCYAIYDMKPENANGTGSLFPWGPVPEPVSPADTAAATTKSF